MISKKEEETMEPQKNWQPWTQNGLVLGDFVISPRSCYRIRIFLCSVQCYKSESGGAKQLRGYSKGSSWLFGRFEAVVVAPLLQHTTQNKRGLPQLLEHRPTHQEVVGMNPAECWDFFLDLPF